MDMHNKNILLNQHLSKLQTELILIDHGLCPDWSRGEHRRRRDCIYLILEGQGKITINGTAYYPKKNDMVLLPKNSIVSLYSENETCYNKYWCDFIMHFDGISLFDVIDFPYVISLDDISRPKELLDLIDQLHLKTDAASALMINAALLELVAMFLKNDNRTVESVKEDEFVSHIKKYIEDNLDEPLSIKTLANEMCFNEKYLIHIFKQHFGMTPARYIKMLRLEKAKQLLIYTDLKAVLIVNNIGYSNIQKFSKDFKEYTGLSPTEFRKNFGFH